MLNLRAAALRSTLPGPPPRSCRRSVEGHVGVLVRPRCGRCHVPVEGHGGVLLRPRCGRRSVAAGRDGPQHGEPQGRQLRGGKEETGSGEGGGCCGARVAAEAAAASQSGGRLREEGPL